MSHTTYVQTPNAGLVISLGEAKKHLRVDDITPGVKASVSFGSADAELLLTAKYDGTYANSYSAELIEDGLNTPLTVETDGNLITINLATNGTGDATSTVNDVIASLIADPIITQMVVPSSGSGSGTGVLGAEGETNLAGGIDGTSDEDDLIESYIRAAQGHAENILRKKLLTTTMIRLSDCFPSCRSIDLEFGPIQEVTEITYRAGDGTIVTWDEENYIVRDKSTPAQVILKYGLEWPTLSDERTDAISIEYETGWTSAALIPVPIKQAIKLYIGHWYSNREEVVIGQGIVQFKVESAGDSLLWPYRDFRF